ncbi:metal-sulfur cluster assembly factor [Paenibacillus sp. GCM10023250]|uniref:metal-sulfur cluster assembly factor n=1 Tax=Paenibacillus sp. GCM10023250 TaxID=3252648 RepID=UPI00360ECF81
MELESAILTALEAVKDPEVGANIVDLGLVYGIEAEANGSASIRLTLTIPECPLADEIVRDVKHAALSVNGVNDVQVHLVWEPKWTPAMMNDNAREEIRALRQSAH